VLARFERAAARFWGTLTRGAHANGYVAGADGGPTHLWIARRSDSKATDPGLFDNLIGGGVPHGQTPHETLVREGFEEAGLTPEQMSAARRGRVIHIDRDVPEGRMVEHVHAFDVELPAGVRPQNQDGEVAAITLLPVAEAAALAAGGTMTVDASLVTLDFLLRHRLLPDDEHADLSARMATLCLP
jgi:8-oxo-dGTP pyrophosphatase MutT (NUDIX family)